MAPPAASSPPLSPISSSAAPPQMPPPPPATTSTTGSISTSPSRPHEPQQFPQGHCRYILILPELKGQRCGCANFNHNKSLPGATCDCGHLACFHMTSADAPSPGKNRDEIDRLKQRVHALEQQADLSGEYHSDWEVVMPRLSQLEETVDKNREDLQNEIKAAYSNSSAAWQLIDQLQQRLTALEETPRIQSEQLARAGKELQDLRNRNLELLETDEMLEERIEKLEGLEAGSSPAQDHLQRKDSDERPYPNPVVPSIVRRRRSSSCPVPPLGSEGGQKLRRPEPRVEAPEVPKPSEAWTVHVSVLPSREQPFPFEKDTNAYKRCLSRGLQRMVAVEGGDGESFVAAVSKAFRDVLQGASWEPLRAKICDARELQGLPMLRALESDLAGAGGYDVDLLREHCAVCDANGRMQSLYVAVRHGNLSWAHIKSLPVYVEGLESSWEYDKYLDGVEDEGDTEPATMDPGCHDEPAWQVGTTTGSSSLKRGASDMQSGGLVKGEMEESRVSKGPKRMPDMIQIR